MLKMLAFILTAISFGANAREIDCYGKHQNKIIKLRGSAPGPILTFATGTLSVDQIEVAHFDGSEMSWNVIDKSFNFTNSRGDSVVGYFDNYLAGLVTATKIKLAGQENFDNVKLKCKTL